MRISGGTVDVCPKEKRLFTSGRTALSNPLTFATSLSNLSSFSVPHPTTMKAILVDKFVEVSPLPSCLNASC